MWSAPSLITFALGFIFPPAWILFVYIQFRESQEEDRNAGVLSLRSATLANLYNSAPAACPSCGGTSFTGGIIRVLDSAGIRSHRFPMSGVTSVCNFTCNNCGSRGRYGLAHNWAENGWILLDRTMGGW